MEFYHEPVMALECIDALDIKKDGIYIDGTAGGCGHSLLIADRLSQSGRLVCIDRDIEAVNYSKDRMKDFGNVSFVNDNFKNLGLILKAIGISSIDGILLDLGVSSRQLDDAAKGFSYMKDAPINMRMEAGGGQNARDIINGYAEEELSRIFFEYGEEKYSRRIASRIVIERQKKPIETTLELAAIIEAAIPGKDRHKGSHPAKRVFQAVRIEVNGELEGLYDFIKTIPEYLNDRGRIAVISFHSLEDRLIKKAFYDLQNPCKCPSDLPVCVCKLKSSGRILYRKPVVPDEDEKKRNPRSKSAKLRAFERTIE